MRNLRSPKIVIIDYGSRGNSGFYLEGILTSYSYVNPVDAYAHHEFVGASGRAKVFRVFDIFSKYCPSFFLKQLIRTFDLYLSLFRIALTLKIQSRKESVVLIVEFYQSFHAYLVFFRIVSRFVKLIITVHDEVELKHHYPKVIMAPRGDIFATASGFIVHGERSVVSLSRYKKPVYVFPFPLMRVDSLEGLGHAGVGYRKFLFIGNIRAEKGVATLVDAWKLAHPHIRDSKLVIAGNYPADLGIDFTGIEDCELRFQYLSDHEFARQIETSHFVVFPYSGGTNSGVLSVCTALRRPCITSRIPMFLESELVDSDLSFDGTSSDLARLIIDLSNEGNERYLRRLANVAIKCENYQVQFASKLNYAFDAIVGE